MNAIDLRSDTLTQPTRAMREAVLNAEFGDDVYREDPTVQRLEKMAAERMGKEAGLYVVSGSMGNFVSILTHCRPGDSIVVGSEAHIVHHELWSERGLGQIELRQVQNGPRGEMDPDTVKKLIESPNGEAPRTGVVCIENTHNRCGGAATSVSTTANLAAIAQSAGVKFHVDGARIFNAALALETTPAALVADADSLTFCLSKGLAGPVGSVICGSGEFIEEARKNRAMVGGAMRQVGVLAAMGIVALEEMVDRLSEDHANARRLAAGIAQIPGIKLDPDVDSNIVIFDVEPGIDPVRLRERMKEHGVLATGVLPRIRLVTHYGIDADDVDQAIERTREAVASLS